MTFLWFSFPFTHKTWIYRPINFSWKANNRLPPHSIITYYSWKRDVYANVRFFSVAISKMVIQIVFTIYFNIIQLGNQGVIWTRKSKDRQYKCRISIHLLHTTKWIRKWQRNSNLTISHFFLNIIWMHFFFKSANF